MSSQAIRVSAHAYAALKELAAESGEPIVRYLDELVREAYRRRLWLRFAEANAAIEADPAAQRVHREEEAIWSVAGADGLDLEEGVEWDDALEDAASW